jgi:hypothetical protein
MESNCLYQKVAGNGMGRFKHVPTYEKVFDIINSANKAPGHAERMENCSFQSVMGAEE